MAIKTGSFNINTIPDILRPGDGRSSSVISPPASPPPRATPVNQPLTNPRGSSMKNMLMRSNALRASNPAVRTGEAPPVMNSRIDFNEPSDPFMHEEVPQQASKNGLARQNQVTRKPLPDPFTPPPTPPRRPSIPANTGQGGMPVFQNLKMPDTPPGGLNRLNHPYNTPVEFRPDAPVFTPAPAPSPYRPIQLTPPESYGTHNAAQTVTTQYARQLANVLVAEDGRLDGTHVLRLMHDVAADKTLPEHQRQHIVTTLMRLQSDPGLRNVIESTCAPPNSRLAGPAADLVRATLNLPPYHGALTPTDARRAVVMSLMGNLRQGKVGSCFASATAIAIQREDPHQLAQDLKQILQTNALSFQSNGCTVDLPVNRRTSRESAQVPLSIDANGYCHSAAPTTRNGKQTPPYGLHNTPAMQAALNAIGVPPQNHQYAIIQVVRSINNGITHPRPISSQEILQHLTRNQPRGHQQLSSALNAFSGSEDVRLLRAWEYTLASHAETDSNAARNQALLGNMVHGNSGGNNHLSLMNQNMEVRKRLLANNFAPSVVEGVNRDLMTRFEQQVQSRFVMQYDADLKQPSVAADGRSNRGGFTLYDRTPSHDPAQWVRIDNPQTFQLALQHMARTAAQETTNTMMQHGTMSGQHKQVIDFAAQELARSAGNPALTDYLVRTMNPAQANVAQINLQQCSHLPWKAAKGGDPVPIGEIYGGGKVTAVANLQPSQDAGQGAFQAINFIGRHLHSAASILHRRQSATNADFSMGVVNSNHAFNIKPGAMREFWSAGSTEISAHHWVQSTLDRPAMDHANQIRTQPSLYSALQRVANEMQLSANDVQQMYGNLTPGWRPGMGPPKYTLAQLCTEVEKYSHRYLDPQLAIASMHRAINNVDPLPTRLIADTNWAQPDGSPTYVGVSFNPYSRKLEANLVNEKFGNQQPLGKEFFEGRWTLHEPLHNAGRAVS